jgi:hypothetical protein
MGGVDVHSGESCSRHPLPVFGEGQRPGDGTDLASSGQAFGLGAVVFGEEVAHAEPAAGPQHAEAFGQYRLFVAEVRPIRDEIARRVRQLFTELT